MAKKKEARKEARLEKKEARAKKKTAKRSKKKDIDISIDTENVDIDIERKDGVFTAELDTKNFDVQIRKDAEGTKIDVQSEGKLGQFIGKVLARKISKKRG
jgi:hypothetical protein